MVIRSAIATTGSGTQANVGIAMAETIVRLTTDMIGGAIGIKIASMVTMVSMATVATAITAPMAITADTIALNWIADISRA